MATPVFKFQHPDLPGEDLYFIHNTFFELPETTPMDLASFVWYHHQRNRTLDGFMIAWKNLCEHQSTLDGVTFAAHFEEKEQQQLYQDALFNNALEIAEHNSNLSKQIHEMLNQNTTEHELFQLINESEDLWVLDVPSYFSRHQLMRYLWDNHQDKIDEHNSYQKDKAIIMELVQQSGLGLVFADDSLKNDIDLLSTAAGADYRAWFFIPEYLKQEVKDHINSMDNRHFIVEHTKNDDELFDLAKVDDETIGEIMAKISEIHSSGIDDETIDNIIFQVFESSEDTPEVEGGKETKYKPNDTINDDDDDLPF